jgi:aminoglycoside/choline kinase family phosphotransferase
LPEALAAAILRAVGGIADEALDWLAQLRGCDVVALEPMPGGAGARRYWRARFADGETRVLMHALPEDPAILPPALRAVREDLPFATLARFLAAHSVPVPSIEAVDLARRWVLLEDLGSVHLCDLRGNALAQRSAEAIRLLARVHALPRAALPYQRCFDAEWIRFELATFQRHGAPRAPADRLEAALAALADWIAALPRAIALRDYQSQNLMIDARGRLRVLDFQDALLAPPELDLAAFLWDSYVERDAAARAALLAAYAGERGAPDRGALAALVVQRKCKDLGRYRFVSEHKGDARYASYVPRARDAVLGELHALPAALADVGSILGEALSEP